MGTYVLTICLFNFIVGFVTAVYLHDARIIRHLLRHGWKRRGDQLDGLGETPAESTVQLAAEETKVAWQLPDEWRAALEAHEIETDASVATVLQTLRIWLELNRGQLVALEGRVRSMPEGDEAIAPMTEVYEELGTVSRQWVGRLRKATDLLEAVPASPERRHADDHIHDYILQVEPMVEDLLESPLEVEIRTNGLKRVLSELVSLLNCGHAYRDSLNNVLIRSLRGEGQLANRDANWMFDPLTGRFNQVGLFSKIESADFSQPGFFFVAITVDRFGKMNESLGVETADGFIRDLSTLLSELMNEGTPPEFCARPHGSLHAFLIAGDEVDVIQGRAERARQSVEAASFLRGDDVVDCTVSCSVVRCDSNDAEKLYQRILAGISAVQQLGGNRTSIDLDGTPSIIESRAFQVRSRTIRDGQIEMS